MTREFRQGLLIALAVVAVALVVRAPGVGHVMTADESLWMLRSAEFYEKLQRGDVGGTYLTTHPGSVPMWLIGFGESWAERRLGIAVDEGTLSLFRAAAVWPLVMWSSVTIGIIVWLLGKLLGTRVAVVSGVLLACEPYIVGMNQIAHLDGGQGLLMLASLLAFLLALRAPHFDRINLAVAGILWGLAMGFKLILAGWLWPVFFVLLGIRWWQRGRHEWRYAVRVWGLVTGVAVLVFWLLWPALWVKADVGRSLVRDYGSVVTDEHVSFEESAEPIAPGTFYIRTVLGRLTPHVQILVGGVILLIIFAALKRRRVQSQQNHEYGIKNKARIVTTLLVYATGYLVLITLAAKKADRYALPALVVGPVVAGVVGAWTWEFMQRRYQWPRWSLKVAGVLLLAAVVSLPLLHSPHALAYNNPWLPNIRPLSQQGWGEGLEEAAAWLNARPQAEDMYIASWYVRVMQNAFKGKTLSLSSREDYRVQYIVAYRNMGGRGPDDQATAVLEELRDQEPVHTVYIQGVPYVWIYDTQTVGTFSRHIGEVFGQKSIGQTIPLTEETWSWIDIGFATFSSRTNTGTVVVHIRTSPDSAQDLRTITINAGEIVDNEWQRFEFEPLRETAGQTYYVVIDSPTSKAGNAITVRYIDYNTRPGALYVNGQAKEGDMAYRIHD